MSEQLALGKLTARSALLLNRFVGLGGVPAAINKTPQKRLLPTREQPDAPVREETSQRLCRRAVRLCTPYRTVHPGPLYQHFSRWCAVLGGSPSAHRRDPR